MREEFVAEWEKRTKEYMILVDDLNHIEYINPYLKELIFVEEYDKFLHTVLRSARGSVFHFGKRWFRLSRFTCSVGSVLFLTDITAEKKLTDELESLKKVSEDFQMLFDRFGDSSIYIADANGVTTWVGSSVAEEFGVSVEYLLGKNVYDLEKEGIFYPSVTRRVMETLQSEMVTLKTATGKRTIAMGFPLFDKNNKLVKIISFSKQYRYKGGNSIDGMLKSIDYEADIFYPELIAQSSAMAEVKNLIELCSKVDSSFIIYGEKGSGKESISRVVHRLSKRNNAVFKAVSLDEIPESMIEETLFGSASDPAGKPGLIREAEHGTLYISEAGLLPYNCQLKILDSINTSQGIRSAGEQSSYNVRFIFGSTHRLEEEIEHKRMSRELLYRINVVEIECLPLRKRREDILLLTKYFLQTNSSFYDVPKSFTPEALKYLYAYDWPGNITELKEFVESVFLDLHMELVDKSALPAYIVENTGEQKSDRSLVIQKIMPLEHAVELVERQMITLALKESKNASKAAKKLGLNQSTMSRKMQKYNISVRDFKTGD
ncbi:MAG: sigma 54-interacting transcriptional regulator [Lachnospiraceae bacterium]